MSTSTSEICERCGNELPEGKFMIQQGKELFCEDCLTVMLHERLDRIEAEVRKLRREQEAARPSLQEILADHEMARRETV